jgi:hypothetical protein
MGVDERTLRIIGGEARGLRCRVPRALHILLPTQMQRLGNQCPCSIGRWRGFADHMAALQC